MDLEDTGAGLDPLPPPSTPPPPQAAEASLVDPWVRHGDLLALQRRVLRLGKPPRRWAPGGRCGRGSLLQRRVLRLGKLPRRWVHEGRCVWGVRGGFRKLPRRWVLGEKNWLLVAGERDLHRVDFVLFSHPHMHRPTPRWRCTPIATLSPHCFAGGGVPLGRRGPCESPARSSSWGGPSTVWSASRAASTVKAGTRFGRVGRGEVRGIGEEGAEVEGGRREDPVGVGGGCVPSGREGGGLEAGTVRLGLALGNFPRP